MTNTIDLEKQNKIYASVSTLMLLLLLMLIIFFIKFYPPNPPFDKNGGGPIGLEVNFGNTDDGSGTDYSQDLNPTNNKQDQKDQVQSEPNSSPDNNVISEDDPNNAYVKNDKPKKDIKKDVVKDQQPDKNLVNALNNLDDKDHSDGNKDKNGNQGNLNGGNSPNYDGNSPTGVGGDGGPGKFPGKGVNVSLKGRRIYYPPEKITDFSEEGTIVVDIVVDKFGKVTFAEVNRAKSINPNYVLCAKARQAAMTTKFNESPDGTLEQKGSITFEFKLK